MADTQNTMKAVIFAGGVGTRMWPLSRKSSPKQFEPIIDDKSTLQLAVDRLRPEFPYENIYISTGEVYRQIIIDQLPQIPQENIIGEPEMRDVAPAVGYLMGIIAKKDPHAPVAILWSDHLVNNVPAFKKALLKGGEYLRKNPQRFVFIGQKPRFANQNLGWIEYGDTLDHLDDLEIHQYKSWHYRPNLDEAKKYFESGYHAWNPGYFVVTPQFVLDQFQIHAPEMYQQISSLQQSYGDSTHAEELKKIYPQMQKISFDDAVLTKTSPDQAVVITVDLGWSDIGTWEALKEALQKTPTDNITHGNVQTLDTHNSVVYNYNDMLVTTIDLDDMVVVATKDAILVTKQTSIPKIKEMLKTFENTPLEKYT